MIDCVLWLGLDNKDYDNAWTGNSDNRRQSRPEQR
jgi:hypothetical protein